MYGTIAQATATISACTTKKARKTMSWYAVSSTIATMKILAMSFRRRDQTPSPLGWLGDDSPQERRLSFPSVSQAGSDGENRHHGRHDDQPKVQRPARPSKELLDAAIQYFQDCVHGLLFLPKSGDRVAVRGIQPVLANQR